MFRTRAHAVAILALAVLALAVVPATSSAKIQVGIGDQNAVMFTDQLFKDLKVKRARIVVPWNTALNSRDRKFLDQWLNAAGRAGVTPLVHFGSSNGTRCPKRPCRAPTVKQYRRAFRAFRKRYPTIRDVGVWNEGNQRAQPTFKKPKLAAQYFNVVRKACRGCRIVAADVLDDPNMVRWLKVFKKTARGARIWGLHNYRDVNPRRGQIFGGTKRLLKTVRGQIWFTETGGIVKFRLPNNHLLFPFSESRANGALKKMFRLARKYKRRVKRLYIYNWRAPIAANRFDAGLLEHGGKTRPGYFTVKNTLRTSLFRQ
jgi:polysaccharide biosynthesis protein PslG